VEFPPLEAFFQPAAGGGDRLYLHHTPPAGTDIRGAIVYLHPWAEELNKSRRMVAMTSRALAADGWSVLQVDLLGCGDSSGDFGDATWSAWLDDVDAAAGWMCGRHPGVPLWLWGLRLGALLAATAEPRVARRHLPPHLLFWQPVLQGKVVLQQFLRLKAAANLAAGGGKAVIESARASLAAGQAVEVAGYRLHPELAGGLQVAQLMPSMRESDTVRASRRRLIWLEVSGHGDLAPSPSMQAGAVRWQDAGWAVQAHAVAGAAFWQTAEIEDAPGLNTATLAALNRVGQPSRPTPADPVTIGEQ
jgi:exosortase A-associated hydrolase 2